MLNLSCKKNRSRWPGRRRRMAAIPIPPNRACPHSCTLTCAHSRLNSKYTTDYHLLGIHHWIVPRSLSSRSPHQQPIFKTYVTRFREVHSFFHLRSFENRRMIDFQNLNYYSKIIEVTTRNFAAFSLISCLKIDQ